MRLSVGCATETDGCLQAYNYADFKAALEQRKCILAPWAPDSKMEGDVKVATAITGIVSVPERPLWDAQPVLPVIQFAQLPLPTLALPFIPTANLLSLELSSQKPSPCADGACQLPTCKTNRCSYCGSLNEAWLCSGDAESGTAGVAGAKTLCCPFEQPDMPEGQMCIFAKELLGKDRPATQFALWGRSY